MTTIVILKEDHKRFNLQKGDWLEVKPYWLDPSDKFTVIRRLRDGYDPSCNVYREQVELVRASGTK